jgi:hypothetical protein
MVKRTSDAAIDLFLNGYATKRLAYTMLMIIITAAATIPTIARRTYSK